jgi:hypothetical protein
MDPSDILLPAGGPIGTPSEGGDEKFGMSLAADSVQERFTSSWLLAALHIRVITPAGRWELPSGGFIGIRGEHTETPTIDVNLPAIPQVRKLHF